MGVDIMFEDIKDKTIVITGARSGIGACMVKLFASYGANVGLHCRKITNEVNKLLKDIKKESGNVEIFKGDLLDLHVRQNLVKLFVEKFGSIDVLINNAGAIYGYKHFSELDEKLWDKTFEINTKVSFYLSGQAFDHMKEHGGGRIINISSVNVKYGGTPKSFHYVAAKAALDALTIGFAREGAKYDILVNSIRCGVIDTPMITKIEGYDESSFKRRIDLIPLKRAGKPIDIARMALFLASDCGNFITGEIFTVAGGD